MAYRFNRSLQLPGRVYHGGTLHGILDFSVSLNPYPLPGPVAEAIGGSNPVDYPDQDGSALKSKLSTHLGIRNEELLIVNGISQGIFLISLLFIEPGDPVLILGPTYGEYEKNSLIFGGRIHRRDAIPSGSFSHEIPLVLGDIEALKPKLVWLCSPNNPTGRLFARGQLEAIAQACEAAGSLLVIDEAYLMMTDDPAEHHFSHPSALIMHSLTKDFSLAGLRIGYIAGDERIIAGLKALQPAWSMNSPALAAAAAALDHIALYEGQWASLRHETQELVGNLHAIGIETIPTDCNIILARKRPSRGGGTIDSSLLAERLLSMGVVVRDCTSFGLPDFIRIGTRRAEENRILLEALGKETLWEL